MAGLQRRNGRFRVLFRFRGKQFSFTLGKVSDQEAEAKSAQIDYLLLRIDQRLVELPVGVGIVEFLRFDGKPPRTAGAAGSPGSTATGARLDLAALRDRYLAAHAQALEPHSLTMARTHFGHLARSLGPACQLADLTPVLLQEYVNARALAGGRRGRRVSAVTIQKDIATFRAAWNWAVKSGLVAGPAPIAGLRYPKTHDKPPFQTRAEIERRLARGGLSAAEVGDLWDTLYLRTEEVAALLEHMRTAGGPPCLAPMIHCAAHTGARRSELIRAQVGDADFAAGHLVVRECKRVRGRRSLRRVPLTPALAKTLEEWLAAHPGGSTLFAVVDRDGVAPREMTRNEAHRRLRTALAGGPWAVMRGWHTLRHSFISACATRAVDQRMIQEWCGHMSAEMSRRYAHLYPDAQRQALASVFG